MSPYWFNPNPLECLDINDIDSITDWHERSFIHVDTLPYIDATNQTSHYLSTTGKEAYRLLKDLSYPTTLTSMKVTKMQDLLH